MNNMSSLLTHGKLKVAKRRMFVNVNGLKGSLSFRVKFSILLHIIPFSRQDLSHIIIFAGHPIILTLLAIIYLDPPPLPFFFSHTHYIDFFHLTLHTQ